MPHEGKFSRLVSFVGKFAWFSGDFDKRYDGYMDELSACLGHADRVKPFKSYCTGLMLPVERKSIEPMAAQLEPERTAAAHQSLLHFVGQSPWDECALLTRVRETVLPVLSAHSPVNAWIIDDTGFPKKGKHSVGVGRQYCGQLGKQDNCQAAVSLSVATKDASLPIAWRLYLPEAWADDAERRRQARIPDHIQFQTKTQIALEQIKAAKNDGVVQATILADAGYGKSTAFRDELDALGLPYIVGVNERIGLWEPGYTPQVPQKGTKPGKTPKNLRRNGDNASVGQAREWIERLYKDGPNKDWQNLCWRDGLEGADVKRFTSRFLRVRVRVANGDHKRNTPRSEQWLLVEWPEGEDKPLRYWISNLPESIDFKTMVFTAKHRWRIEEDYLNLKQECGLGHYEGRSWPGFHHHCALSIAAYAFLTAEKVVFSPSKRRNQRATKQLAIPKGQVARGRTHPYQKAPQ